MNEEIVLRKLLIRNKVTELKNLCTYAYSIACNWESQLEKKQLSLERE